MPRQSCQQCKRPLAKCYCSALEEVDNKIKVLILQHPLEENHPFNTGRMAHLALTNSELLVAEHFSDTFLANILCTPSVLLYPSLAWLPPNSESLSQAELSANSDIQQLIVIDATWRKSKKILHLHPMLQNLPRLSLTGDLKSNYQIRKSSLPDSLSTIESIAKALKMLEPEKNFDAMLKPFQKMIALQQLDH